jgi:hypothetical protein
MAALKNTKIKGESGKAPQSMDYKTGRKLFGKPMKTRFTTINKFGFY